MLEEMQGKRAGAVKQEPVSLLQVVEIAVYDFVDQLVQSPAIAQRRDAFLVQSIMKLAGRRDQFLGRIEQQGRQDAKRERAHHAISIGVFFFGEPKRLTSVSPPEQPLPNEKPQEPRMSKASAPVSR